MIEAYGILYPMKKQQLSDILRQLMFNRNMKIIDLARAAGVPQPTVQRMVVGDSTLPHLSSLVPIAEFFKISVNQLLGKEPLDYQEHTIRQLEEIGIRHVPLLAWDAVMSWLSSNEITDIPKVLTQSPVGARAYALAIKDAAMMPLFSIGTQVIVDPDAPCYDRCYIVAKLAHCPDPVFRQLVLDMGDKFLKPLSPDLTHFRMHMLNEEDILCGVLIEAKQYYAG